MLLLSARHGRWWALGGLVCLLTAWAARGDGAREFLIQNWTREHGVPGNTVTAVAQTPDGYLWVGTLGGLARFDGVRFVPFDLQRFTHAPEAAVVSLYSDSQVTLWVGTDDGNLIRISREECTVYQPPSRQTADRPLRRMARAADGALWLLNFEGGLHRFSGGRFESPTNQTDYAALAADAGGRVWVIARGELLTAQGGRLTRVWDASVEPGFQPEALAPARAGGCWVAGNGSVRRFENGQPRETRALPPGKPATPSDLVEDQAGNLWVARYGGGVVRLDRNGVIQTVTREQGLPTDLVRCLFEDREGDLWAGLEGRGLVCIRPATFSSYGRGEGLSGETVLCVCEGGDGEMWIGTNGDGVYRIKAGQIRHYGAEEGLTNQFVWALLRDRSGRLLAGTWGGGLFRLDDDRFQGGVDGAPGAGSVVLALYEDARGALWLGQRIADERRIEAIEDGHRRVLQVPGDSPRIDVRSIAETRDGSLWFAAMEQGLFRYKNGLVTRCGPEEGFPAGPISALQVDDDGTLWVAIAGVGLVLGDPERFRAVNAARGMLEDTLNQLTDDGLGYLWCGARSGVLRVKKEDLRRLARGETARLDWRRFTRADGLPSNQCSGQGCRARDGRIWFPTATGVAVVDPRRLAEVPAPPPVVIEEVRLAGKPVWGADGGLFLTGAQEGQADRSRPATPAAGSTAIKIPPGGGPLDIVYTALSFAAPERVRFRYQLTGLEERPGEASSARSVRYSYLPPGKYEFRVTACNEGGAWNEAEASLAFEVMPRYWQTWWFRLTGIGVMLAASAGAARWMITRRLRRRLAALEQQRALEVERSRIAQDLHDDLGTSLTEINFLSAMAASPASSPAEVRESLGSITAKSLALVKALDEIVWAVNPKNDSLPNLVNYLCLFAQDYLRPASIQCRLDIPLGLPELPLNAEERHTLFLVTKEALANAAKHSRASEVRLRMALEASLLRLVIEDNGRGFDPAALKGDRNGLRNIEGRMRHLGGRATVHSAIGQGTRVELELPLG